MFGCYRRSEAADPDTYTGAIALVLAHYPMEVVEVVTDPYAGLPGRKTESGWSGLPDVADVREACDNEVARRTRMAKYTALPRSRPYILSPISTKPGAFATVFVASTASSYARFVERSKTADPREWRYDEAQQGIWVVWSWLETTQQATKRFQPFSDDKLIELYGKPMKVIEELS